MEIVYPKVGYIFFTLVNMIFFRLVYKPGSFPDGYPGFLYGDGDGTVNIQSLAGCLNWQGKQKKKIYYETFSNLDHMSILYDKNFLDYLASLITKL